MLSRVCHTYHLLLDVGVGGGAGDGRHLLDGIDVRRVQLKKLRHDLLLVDHTRQPLEEREHHLHVYINIRKEKGGQGWEGMEGRSRER